ncbi:MAG: chemotaxis protein CheW [Candidatus Krumholzibacteriia bacterium]
MTATAQIAQTAAKNLGGEYLTFIVAEEEYGLEILKVREIIGMMEITKVPRTPHFVEGVINLRGKVIAVVDIRRKFELETVPVTDETCVIVVEVNGTEIGLIVDRVSEVRHIEQANIEDAPSFGALLDAEFLLGIGKTAENVIMLLDIGQVLADVARAKISDTQAD